MTSLIPFTVLLAVIVFIFWNGIRAGYDMPVVAPQRPSEDSSAGGAIGDAVGLVVTLASLCWCLVFLALFLAPLALLLMWVAS